MVYFALKTLFVLCATEDPELLDELWDRDGGSHRQRVFALTESLINLLHGALLDTTRDAVVLIPFAISFPLIPLSLQSRLF